MIILVVSDSHGNKENLKKAAAVTAPDLILHLGDHESDCAALRTAFPDVPLRAVRGNCDRPGFEPDSDEFVVDGKRIFMTHGHSYGVKYGLADIVNKAMLRGADILLFGHTHIPYCDEYEGLYIVNPGSVGKGDRSYAVLDVNENGIKAEIRYLDA